jgi:excisionase family DNA binding protein
MLRGIRAGAARTGLGQRTVWDLVRRNALPHRRVGTAVLFVPAELEAWIAAGCPTEAGAAEKIQKGVRP